MIELDPTQLLAMDKLSGVTLPQVASENPTLYGQLAAHAGQQRRAVVLAAFNGVSKPLQDVLGTIDFSPAGTGDATLSDIILAGITRHGVSADLGKEVAQRLLETQDSATLNDPAALDQSLAEHPLFQAELHQAAVVKIGVAAGLATDAAGRLATAAGTPAGLDDATIGALVGGKVLAPVEAARVGRISTLYHLTDDPDLAHAIDAALPPPATGSGAGLASRGKTDGPVALPALAALGTKGWTEALTRGKVTPPEGLSIPEYANRLDQATSGMFPTDALMGHVLMGHGALMSHGAAGAGTGGATDLYRLNPTVELLALDYSPDSADVAALNFGTLNRDQQAASLGEMKAYQRIFALTDRPDHTYALVNTGYKDAISIGTQPYEQFRSRSGLDEATATAYHQAAQQMVGKVTATVTSVVDVVRGGFDGIAVGNVLPSVQDYLKKMPGFADLFGNQDYCDCGDCQSILSPAAYFVDLMSFVEEHVGDTVFAGPKATDPLNLKVRRPDLWTLPLTCENTNTLIPYLDIINEICENYLARRTGYAGSLTDRSAVRDYVYHQRLSTAVDSFQQPFTLPLERLAAYLARFDRTRAEIARTLGSNATTVAHAMLGFSLPSSGIVTTAHADLTNLSHVYGVTFTAGGGGVVNPLNVQPFLAAVGIDRDTLGQLVAARFVTAAGAEPISLITSKSGPDAVQNDIEQITGLRAGSLDRMHRFTRLSRALPWTIAETDLVLAQLVASGVPAGLGAPTLTALVDVLDLHHRFGLPAEQNCALWSAIPRTALPSSAGSLFDRLFNPTTYVTLDGALPKDTVSFVHPSLRSAAVPSPADNTLHRLLAALGVTDSQLAALITHLATALGANLTATNEDGRGFPLTAANLTVLYRHARLAKLLGLSVGDLFALIRIAGLAGDHVADMTDLRTLLDVADWRSGSGYSLDDIAVATGATPANPASYPDPAAIATAVVTRIATDKDLSFADTVFAFIPGVTEAQSRAIVAANATAFVPSADGTARQLATTFDTTAALTVPADVTVAETDLRAALILHHTSTVLPLRLAGALAIPVDVLTALIGLTGTVLGSAGLVSAAQGGTVTPLVDLIGALVPLCVALKAKPFDAAAVTFLGAHGTVFGVTNYTALDLAALRRLSVYARLAVPAGADQMTDGQIVTVRIALRQVLASFDATTKFANTATSALGTVFGAPASLVATVVPHLNLPSSAPEALDMLGRAVALATSLGLGGDALALIVSDDFGDQTRASEAMLSAIRARYPNDKDFADRFDPAEDDVRGRARDALCDYLIRSLRAEFTTMDDIYQYLLVDVQLEGCARTSRVVAAISSAQLYVYRVLMNLEQDRRDRGDPDRTEVPPALIPADEWTWRKNYRVWEANRKVFLWPENYLEPELRDDKTPLFTDLESTLLQQEITTQNVLDSYAAYMGGFDELSGLALAGVYHDKDPFTRTDILHQFGVTSADPPVYYYRTVTNAYYGETSADRNISFQAWRKIDVQIPVRRVAPIVASNRLFVFWTDVTTSSKNTVKDGASTFTGYRHHLSMRYTCLRLDGRWTAPQAVTLSDVGFPIGEGVVDDPLAEQADGEAAYAALAQSDWAGYMIALRALSMPRYDTKIHLEPVDGYTLSGFQWDRVYPTVDMTDTVRVTGRNFIMNAAVDFYRKTLVQKTSNVPPPGVSAGGPPPVLGVLWQSGGWGLYLSHPLYHPLSPYARASIVIDQRHLNALAAVYETKQLASALQVGLYTTKIGTLLDDPDAAVVNGSPSDAIFDLSGDQLYVQTNTRPGTTALVKRLSTTLGETMTRTLFAGGTSALLATANQLVLGERAPRLVTTASLTNAVVTGKIDYTGSFGTYYREIFFHIPFLIANHLNAQGQYEAAQDWYRYIFDPTASEKIVVPNGTPAAQAAKMRRDRVWRYREFRGLDAPSLRAILTDPAAIEAYHKDPFNPHAIARLRMSAYQKCIVMKYVDNLLDWGDSLFTAFTMESVNEATMLYVAASDILGPRPAKVGDCGDDAANPRTYEAIAPLIKKGSEFLIEMENILWYATAVPAIYGVAKRVPAYSIDRSTAQFFLQRATAFQYVPIRPGDPGPVSGIALGEAGAGGVLGAVAGGRDGQVQRLPAVPIEDPARVVGRAPVPHTPDQSVQTSEARIAAHALGTPQGIVVNALVADAGAGAAAMPGGADENAIAQRVVLAEQRVLTGAVMDVAPTPGVSRFGDWKKVGTDHWGVDSRGGRQIMAHPSIDEKIHRPIGGHAGFGWSVVRQIIPVFCVPANTELQAYWDRVADRLYKLRHCLDITGTSRRLALFAPEIDPRLLVRARAAGLSIEDVLGATSGDLPPYRFGYLIEKARQHATAVASFGGALLGALERKDVEEMNRLHATHQQHMLAMTTRVRQWEIDLASDAANTVAKQIEAVTFRRDYYVGLLQTNLNPNEAIQLATKQIAVGSFITGSILQGTGGVLSLIPQLGSPFAMKYGGIELSGSAKAWGAMLSDTAKMAEVISAAAGLEAGFDRRREGWTYQRDLANQELAQLKISADAAAIRFDIANRSLDIHNKQVDQQNEVLDLMGSRFTNLGLYTWLASTLQRLYREAYTSAYATARLAEQAFRFERNDDATTLLRGGYFDAGHAGLLAGEQLLMDLETMDRRFVETNYRTPEVDQSFSLAQIDPSALVRLREGGECAFEVPEVFFDLFYPGQYRRRIKAVRLTIPSVTGPYTNVGATLTLTGSKLRRDPVLGAAGLADVPLRRSVAIATSTAQNDAGVFEFSFRDERYMPFEGAGAISSWQLTMPSSFRPFDYQTITDVIVHISYTAAQDDVLRSSVEAMNATLDGTILNYLTTNGLRRVYSLRQDFSTAFNRLLHSPAATPVKIELTDRHLPVVMRERNLAVASAKLVLRTPAGQTVAGVSIGVDGTAATGFTHDSDLGDLYSADLTAVFAGGLLGERTLTVNAAGDLAPNPVPVGDPSAFDATKLLDAMLYLELKLA